MDGPVLTPSQECASAGKPRGLAALFALADTALCGDAFKLNFKVQETESVLSPSESVPFSTQAQFACPSPESALLLSMDAYVLARKGSPC